MELRTKYKIGDNVFTLSKEMKIVEKEVKRVSVFVWPDETRVNYDFVDGSDAYERMCFGTKEELIKFIQS